MTTLEGKPDINKSSLSVMPRLHFIDGLRGLAMLMVLIYHCWLFGGEWTIDLPLGRSHVNIASVFSYGHIGVNLFLVLSGFCLYWPFVKGGSRREPTLWEFAKKRCRRILPPYYAALVLFGGAALLNALYHRDAEDAVYSLNWLWIHALMAQNLRPGYVLTINGSLWSLALEFQLYILFPLLVEAYRRFDARAVLWTVLIACSLYRFCLVRGHFLPDDASGYVLAYSVFGRGFEFALGMFTAMLVARRHGKGKWLLLPTDYLVLFLVTILAILDGRHGHFQTLTDAMWGLLFAALILAGSRVGTWCHQALSNRILVHLGIFSYSVYLIHLPLVLLLGGYAVAHFSNVGRILFLLLFTAPLMLGAGYLFHLMFEKPFMSTPARQPVPSHTA
ncbi:MAG: acyltransferase family protein [Janthinobacterium lividum]